MRKGQLLILGGLAAVALAAAPHARAFTSQPDTGAAITGGAPLADPDDKLKTMFGHGDGSGGTVQSGATFGTQNNFRPGAVPGFDSSGYGATYSRGSGKDD